MANRTEAENDVAESNEQVFKKVFIPRSLEEVVDHDTDIKKLKEGDVDMVNHCNSSWFTKPWLG